MTVIYFWKQASVMFHLVYSKVLGRAYITRILIPMKQCLDDKKASLAVGP